MKVKHSGTPTSASGILRLAPRLCLLFSTLVVVPVMLEHLLTAAACLVLAAAGPAGAVPVGAVSVGSGFGAHVSSCAQMSTGFSGDHNPSHHRGPSGWNAGMEC